MTEHTPLDAAHANMQTAEDDPHARLGFYERLAASELFLLLASEVDDKDETVTPELFDVQGERFVLVFDREDRLAAFAAEAKPYVALSGRAIAEMLAGQGLGLGLNLDVAPSSILLPPEAVAWLNDTIGNAPDAWEARISELSPPAGLPERLVASLDTRLATAMGLANAAYLAGVTYEDTAKGHLLVFVAALPEAQEALAQLAAEALSFSGIEAGAMDVAFLEPTDPMTAPLDRVGLKFDIPKLPDTVTQTRPAPGSDPAKPPILK
ncbi:MAG: SseB family protein [Pseudomonadota bacterium]